MNDAHVFFQQLQSSGAMPVEEVRRFQERVLASGEASTAEDLAAELVRQGRLTQFQADRLLSGEPLRIGNYILLDEIGQGGMGQVFLARHDRMKREVALKILPEEAAGSSDSVQRFEREIEAAAKLRHPNIITAHDADEAEGVHFLVMEYIAGRDLGSLVKQRGPLPVEEAVGYIVQAAQGLAHAHAAGVIHRDIKPSNLLLDQDGQIKVADFGLARLVQSSTRAALTATRNQLTHTSTVLGTVDFLAPEQARNIKNADHRADVYSLGCTLYYLLTGKPMYRGKSLMEKIAAHQKRDIPSLAAVRDDVPEALEAVYRRMVAKKPNDRPRSMEEVAKALRPLTNPRDTSARSHGATVTQLWTGADSKVRRRRRIVAIGGVIVALIAAIGTWLFWPGGSVLKNNAREVAEQPPANTSASLAPPIPQTEPSAQESPDWKAAAWVLGQGGAVMVSVNGGEPQKFQPSGQLPKKRLTLLDVELPHNTQLSDNDLSVFRDVNYLRDLNFYGCSNLSDAALDYFAATEDLRTFNFSLTKVTESGVRKLTRNRRLQNLYLWQTQVSGDVVECFRFFPDLKRLSIASPKFNSSVADAWLSLSELSWLQVDELALTPESCSALAGLKNLRELRIVGNLTRRELALVARLPQVTTLNLRHTAGSFDAAVASLGDMTSLRNLTLRRSVGDGAIAHLKILQQLGSLTLWNTAVTREGVVKLQQAMANCRVIYDADKFSAANRRAAQWVLQLGGKLITDQAPDLISDTAKLPKQDFRVRDIRLGGVAGIADDDLVRLREVTRLTSLELHETKITGRGLKHIQGLLELRRLSLYGNLLEDQSLAHLAGLVHLTQLGFSGKRFTPDGLRHLSHLHNLTILVAGHSSVNDAGLAHLAGLKKIRFLALDHTQITDAGLVHLKNMNEIHRLRLASTEISDESVVRLKAFSNLAELDLTDTKITPAGASKLQTALPFCNVIHPSIPPNDRPDRRAALTLFQQGFDASVRLKVVQQGIVDVTDSAMLPDKLLFVQGVTLGVGENEKADLSCLRSLRQLRYVRLDGVKLADDALGHLADCPRLNELELKDVALSNRHVQDLKTMASLRRLVLERAALPAETLDEMRTSLPGCQITTASP